MPMYAGPNMCGHDGVCFCFQGEPKMESQKLAPSKALEEGQGLKVTGFVSGYKSGAGVDGEGVITIHAGKTYNGTNIFNISVSHELAMQLIGQDVDILVVPTGPRYPDDT